MFYVDQSKFIPYYNHNLFFFVYECEDNNYNIPMEIFMVDANLLIISIQMYMIDTYFR